MASYYFPHDTAARNDPKLQEVLIDMGVAGVGLFWCVVEQLYEQDNILPIKSCKSIAFAYHVKEADVKRLIFDFDLFENDGVNFWSTSVEKRMQKRKDLSNKMRENAKKMHEKYHTIAKNTDAIAENNDAIAKKIDAIAEKNDANCMQLHCACNANKINKEIKEKEIYKEKENKDYPSPTIIGLPMKAEELRNDVYRLHADWVEVFCMNNHISLTDFRIWMDEFTRTLQNRDERKTMQDFKSHFASWFAIQYAHAKEKRSKTARYDEAKNEMEESGKAIRQRFDEAKKEKVTHEEYMALKKLAEAGDEEAKKKIGL
jgi:hypothetical protein